MNRLKQPITVVAFKHNCVILFDHLDLLIVIYLYKKKENLNIVYDRVWLLANRSMLLNKKYVRVREPIRKRDREDS